VLQLRIVWSAITCVWGHRVCQHNNCDRLEESEARMSVTPFEKNLEVWKQLWRVVERSDLLIQIVDARNPLLYR
jgi:ribosome biogenesis GTPase A